MKALLYDKSTRPDGADGELHQKMLEGVAMGATAVGSTLGPRGRNVVIDRAGEVPLVTKDGVTVARNITLTDPVHHAAWKMIQAVAIAHERETGDGTTTATVLAHKLFEQGLKLVDEQLIGPVQLQRSLAAACELVVGQLGMLAKPVTDEQIAQVGTISTNGNEAFGKLILEAVHKVGRDGHFSLDDSKKPESWLELTSGFQIRSGFRHPAFITDRERGVAVLENPLIFITERQLTQGLGEGRPELHDLGPLLRYCIGIDNAGNPRPGAEKRPLVIVCDDLVDGSDAFTTILANVIKKYLQICVVRAPGIGEYKRAALDDLALATGGQVLLADSGREISKWVLDKRGDWDGSRLGTCRRVIVSNSTCTFEGCSGDPADSEGVQKKAQWLRAQISDQQEPQQREWLAQRAARLTTQVAVLHVAAPTEPEGRALRDLAEDAVTAVRAALAEGIVPGGGLALFLLGERLREAASEMPGDLAMGAGLLADVMQEPLKLIAKNAGEDVVDVARAVWAVNESQLENPVGFNAATGNYEALVPAGIVDPKKVVRVALEKAVSIAALMLTTSCLVYLDPEANKKQPILQLPAMPAQQGA